MPDRLAARSETDAEALATNRSDAESRRPLAGYVVLNEDHVSYDDGRYQQQIHHFVSGLLHVLFFNAKAFEAFPPNRAGQSFLQVDDDGRGFVRGDSIVREARAHFGCPSVDRGQAPIHADIADSLLTN